MVIYTQTDELLQAVEKMKELQRVIDELQSAMPKAEHQRLVCLAAEVAVHISGYNSLILRENKANNKN